MNIKSDVWLFKGTFFWGLLIILLLIIGQILPLYLYLLTKNTAITLESFMNFLQTVETDAFLLALSVIGSGILVVPIVFFIAKLKKGSVLKDYFSLNGFSLKTLLMWTGVLILLMLTEGLFISASGMEEIPSFMMNIEYPNEMSKWLLLVAIVLVAPILEELVFRGFLLRGFSESFMGMTSAVIITSLLWAIIHLQYDLFYVAIIFFVGIVLSTAKVMSNSLYIPILMHMFMNLAAVIGLFYEKGML